MAPRADDANLFAAAPVPMTALDATGRLACLRLIRSGNVGPVTFHELINHFGGAEQALAALPEISRRASRRRPISVCPAEQAEAELAAAARHLARPIFSFESDYPTPLAHLAVPPPMVYVKGRSELLHRDVIAIVGSRNASAAGLAMTRLLARHLGEADFVIVSGLARGIDAAAHETALATGTIAVLAGGVDFVYPPENSALQARIGEEGCIITEQPPGFHPRGQDFPRRNRIISGLALGVVVVEAARRSGSLITAQAAAEQGREVMAVPGHPLDPRSEGPNALLKQPGVTMVTSPDDILQVLTPMRGGRRDMRPPTTLEEVANTQAAIDCGLSKSGHPGPAQADTFASQQTSSETAFDALLAVLGPSPSSLDDAARAAGISARAARVAVLELALAGKIEMHGGQLISRVSH